MPIELAPPRVDVGSELGIGEDRLALGPPAHERLDRGERGDHEHSVIGGEAAEIPATPSPLRTCARARPRLR